MNKIFRESVQIPTNPQIVDLDSDNIHHKPTNPKINIHHKPRSTKLTTHKPIVRIHISTTIYTTELRDREMKEGDLSIWDRETTICELERV